MITTNQCTSTSTINAEPHAFWTWIHSGTKGLHSNHWLETLNVDLWMGEQWADLYNCFIKPFWQRMVQQTDYIIFRNNGLIISSRQPKSPPSTKWLAFFLHPPFGVLSLKCHKNLLALLKKGPTVISSCTRSSMHLILHRPEKFPVGKNICVQKYEQMQTTNLCAFML